MQISTHTENSRNPAKGREFEALCKELLEAYYRNAFETRAKRIGKPPTEHKFDLVSADWKYAAECKCYAWTKGNNIPSAKRAMLNEAILHLSLLPKKIEKFIILPKATRSTHEETLAHYFARLHRHLLKPFSIQVLEVDVNRRKMTKVILKPDQTS
jgi:hypothetical protein